MAPVNPTVQSLGHLGNEFDFSSWTTGNGSFSGLSSSPDAYVEDPSYDYFSTPFNGLKNAAHDNMDWTPLTASTDGTFFSADGVISPRTTWTPENDSDSCDNALFTQSPVSPASVDFEATKRSSSLTYGSDVYHMIPNSGAADYPPPTKRACPASPTISEKPAVPKSKSTSSAAKTKCKAESKSKSKSKSKTKSPELEPLSSTVGPTAGSLSGHGGNHNIQLRTAARKNKTSRKSSVASGLSPTEVEDEDSLTNEERRQRQNHNLVEKQYRNRLNLQFERLLAVLPADQHGGEDEHHIKSGMVGDGDEKRMSKAEVLDMARRRIKTLEQERRKLRQEQKDLVQKADMMRGAIARKQMGHA